MISSPTNRRLTCISCTFFAAMTAWLGPIAQPALAQRPGVNYDEAKAGPYTLPDPLVTSEGRKVTTPDMWSQVRRPELMRIFTEEVYGGVPVPPRPIRPTYRVHSEDQQALGGKAVRREVTIAFTDQPDGPRIDLLIYVPKTAGAAHCAPAFLGLNFSGNHAVQPDPGITLSKQWMRNNPQKGITDHRATEATRGSETSNWPVERIVARGYALATAYYGDIDPDFDDGFQNGVHPLFYHSGQTKPEPGEWGSIGAWAWGLSQALDYLETLPEIDAKRVVLMGHSRLGKTALWAGAQDPRFAIVISNNSGRGRRGALQAYLRRNRRTPEHVLSPLVLRQLPQVQQP